MDMLTGAMGSLLPKLRELLVWGYNLQTGVKEDVEFLEREMRSMNAALIKVAKVPRDQLDNQVIVWADELRDLSYDMEDVVDNFPVCIEGSESFANAIRDIKNRAQEVADRRDRYKVDDAVANAAGKHKVNLRVMALYKDHKELAGIEDARDKLTKRLRDGPKQQHHKMKIVSIVGPGGLGKTTLARAVYNRLQAEFEYKAFVPVGRNPEVKKVLRDILLEVDKSERMGDVVTLDEIQLINKLQQLLANGRYFIVIDDIWDLKAWEYIKCALIDNNHGSRVITTTCTLDVAKNIGDIYKLEPLSQHQSEELFYTRLFGGKDKCLFDQPAEVLKEVLQKCGGVPLAIITLASLLAGKPMEDWSKVFNSIGFESGDNNTDVGNTRKILYFSYYDLPCHLRSCLLHLSAYPKDYLIDKNKLIWQWVAEGFVSEEPGVSLFETGERYFNELSNRSMIQPVEHPKKYTIYACRIHDMVLNMICELSKEYNFVTILDSNEEHTPSQCNGRRLAVQKRVVPLANMSMPKLRSWYATMCDPNVVPSLSNFQVLRVLAMEKCSFERDRPYTLEHIGRLPQLRYLSLESTNISKLPEEIGDLKFLQTLDLKDTHIKELPQSIGLLRKLKRLRAGTNAVGITVPNGIGNLTSLVELNLTTAGESSIFVKELSKLTELRVLICNLISEVDKRWNKTFVESLCHLRKIHVLKLRCCIGEIDDYWKGYEPPRQLSDLVISNRGGFRRLPAWINSSLLPNLSNLCVIVNWGYLGKQDVVNLGSLPELTYFGWQFIPRGMEIPDGAFPKLRRCFVLAPFRFLQGSMQSLEDINIKVDVRDLKDAGTDLVFIGSLGNLPSLRTVYARFDVYNAYISDYKKMKAAVRQAINTHPNSPTLDILRLGQPLAYDSEDSEDEETGSELSGQEGFDDDDDDHEDEEESDSKEESDSEEAEQEGSDDGEDEEESDSESEQESHHDDDNRPVPRLAQSSVDVAATSPLVPALKKRKFPCLNSGSSSSAAKSRGKGSLVWQYFIQDGGRAYCNRCTNGYAKKKGYAADSKKDGTSRLRRHLKKAHNITLVTEDHIKAARVYIETLTKSAKHGKQTVVSMEGICGETCTAKMLQAITSHEWLNGAVINSYCNHMQTRTPRSDRHVLSSWVSDWLLLRASGKVKNSKKNCMEHFTNKSKTVSRVADEYFAKDKAYFPFNLDNLHWITVVMHNTKKEFQVLDSTDRINARVRSKIATLRAEIAKDTQEVNSSIQSDYPDVSSWPIKEYEMPRQHDEVSCGLFVMKCVEHWDGDEWTYSFDQKEINSLRGRILAEILFSESNTLDKVKDKILKIMEKE